MYYEDLKTSFYKIIYNGRNISEEENMFNVPLSNIFGDMQIVDLKIIKNLREETSMIVVDAILKKFEIDKKYSQKFLDIIYKMIQTVPTNVTLPLQGILC